MRLVRRQQHMMRGDDAEEARFKTSHSDDDIRAPKLKKLRFSANEIAEQNKASPVHERSSN
jgi:hypothetical protein